LKTFTVDAIAGADAYVWGITGASAGNKIKTGFGSRTVTFIVKSVPATVFVSATNYCNQSDTSAATIACALNPTTPTAITGVKNLYNCTSTLQTYKVAAVAGNTYSWAVTGTGNQLVSSAADSAVFAMVAAGNLTVTAKTACNQTGVSFTQAIIKSTTLAVPASITAATVVSNVCGARVVRYTAPALPTGTSGYSWSLANINLGASLDSGVLSGAAARYIRVKFTSNAAAATTDSIKLAYTYDCGVTGTKGLKVALTALTVPAAPTAVTVTSLGTATCGQPRYRYAAPATGLPAATTTAGAATGWEWSFYGTLGATFVVDSADLASRVVTGYFTSTAAHGLGDTVKCRYTSVCGFSAYKAAALTNAVSSSNAPATPASVTATLVSDVCGARVYRYAAPVLPAGTATNAAPTGYEWSLPTGSAVAASGTLDSGVLSGRYIRVIYTSNAGAVTGDSIRVRYTSACGVGANKALKLTNVAKVCLVGAPVYSKTTNTIDGIKAQVYPNPNAGNFTVRIETGVTAKANASIQIIDMNGRMVENFTAVNNNGLISQNINNSNLTNGVYTVRYTVGTVTNVIKMVVQK